MAQDTLLGFPAHTLPYRCRKLTTLSTVSPGAAGFPQRRERGTFHTETMKNFWKQYRKLHIWLAADATVLGLYLALRHSRRLMNAFAAYVTSPLKAALGRLCALTSLSVMEVLYVLAAAGAAAYIVWSIFAVVKAKGSRRRRAGTALLGAADILLTIYALFCLMWGVNYWTDSFQEQSGITAQPVAAEDLKAVTAYFARQLADTADTVPRDENGVYAVPKEQILSESRQVYGGVTELFPFLDFPDTGVKAVRCSRLMSVMGFTGVYFACIGESNVNVDSPACLLPSTIAHELAHQRGIAREQECNFLGVLASVTSGMPEYAYSGWLLGFIHLGNALYETDPEAYWAIRDTLPDTVRADLRDNNAYWDQFRDNVVEKVSDTVYDAALKSYGDANGMKSYSMVVELLVAYYRDGI